MYFSFFNFESILGFTSTFVDICSATSHTFDLKYRRKLPPIGIIKYLVNTLNNQENKVELIRLGEYGALDISSELMSTCHKMNTKVKTNGGYAFYLNGKIKSLNNPLVNITRKLMLN